MSSVAIATKTIPVAKPSFGRQEEDSLMAALRSGWVTQGPRVAEFERKFAEYVGAPHAVAVSSCTTGLHLGLWAIGVKAGDEVICPSLSFIATANSIAYTGATPVFADVDPVTCNITAQSIEKVITPRTKAILLVHQIGHPADLGSIAEVAKRHGILLIEDAACAIGAEYQGVRVGLPHSIMAVFSFHPRKILTTGEGGMITTADASLADRMRRARQHAMGLSDLARHGSSKVMIETYDEVGFNYRMTDLQAAIGLIQLQRVDGMLARRRELAARYLDGLSGVSWLMLPQEAPDCRQNYQSFMVRLTEDAPISREQLMQDLLDRGISSRRGIMAIHREAPYRDGDWEDKLPVTNRITETGLILPLFHEMTDEEHDFVVESIVNAGR
jgi:perosamine synthetase